MNAELLIHASQHFDLNRAAIPQKLREVPRWVTWRLGPPKPSGKFDKVPVNPITGRNMSANDPKNWLSFDDACKAYDTGKCSGIGIALTDEPVGTWGDVLCGAHQYLVALDFDHCTVEHAKTLKKLRHKLGGVYAEVSPSGQGVRMLALSRLPIKGGNAGDGREMYGDGRFVTVTGISGHGPVLDATDGLTELEREWFPPKSHSTRTLILNGSPAAGISKQGLALAGHQLETADSVTRVKSQLAFVSADCSYERWRNVVWSVISSQWDCATDLARQWSQTVPERYDQKTFDQLAASFDSTRGITLGTLDHYARESGWQPMTAANEVSSDADIDREAKPYKRLLTGNDLKALPRLTWRIRGLLPSTGLAAIYGPSGSAKTFFALAMAGAISAGQSHWFGSMVKPSSVAYVALEGEGGIRQRLAAWEAHHATQAPDKLRFVLGNFKLIDSADVEVLADEIIQTLGTGVVVFIDTLNQSAPGSDENASADMGRVISNAKALAAAIDGIVILVHHAGKDVGRGMRGHSSLFAAMDAVIEVASNAAGRTWKVAKSKDGITGVAHTFELVPYTVGKDEDGLDVTSCAIRQALPKPASLLKPISGKNQKAAHAALTGLVSKHPDGIPLVTALTSVGQALDCEDRRRADRAADAIRGLTESGHINQSEGVLFLNAS